MGRSPWSRKGYPLQYSGLENTINCIVHGVAKSWMRLSDLHFHFPRTQHYHINHLRPGTVAKAWQMLQHTSDGLSIREERWVFTQNLVFLIFSNGHVLLGCLHLKILLRKGIPPIDNYECLHFSDYKRNNIFSSSCISMQDGKKKIAFDLA